MNRMQRRLFRVFLESGGDLSDESEVDRFVRNVEAALSLLPPKVKEAIELVWAAEDTPQYERVVAEMRDRCGVELTPTALRQRVCRGLRFLEGAVRRRRLGGKATAELR